MSRATLDGGADRLEQAPVPDQRRVRLGEHLIRDLDVGRALVRAARVLALTWMIVLAETLAVRFVIRIAGDATATASKMIHLPRHRIVEMRWSCTVPRSYWA